MKQKRKGKRMKRKRREIEDQRRRQYHHQFPVIVILDQDLQNGQLVENAVCQQVSELTVMKSHQGMNLIRCVHIVRKESQKDVMTHTYSGLTVRGVMCGIIHTAHLERMLQHVDFCVKIVFNKSQCIKLWLHLSFALFCYYLVL